MPAPPTMGSDAAASKAKEALATDQPRDNNSTSELPQYFDSEPSSQPPGYHHEERARGRSAPSAQRPEPQHAGASPASIAAVLGYSGTSAAAQEREAKAKTSRRQRFKDWLDSWKMPEEDQYDRGGSTPNWNYFGARLDGRENKARSGKRG